MKGKNRCKQVLYWVFQSILTWSAGEKGSTVQSERQQNVPNPVHLFYGLCMSHWMFSTFRFDISRWKRSIVTAIINKIYQINTKTLENTAQIICLNMSYRLRNCCNCCSVSFGYQLMIRTVNLFWNWPAPCCYCVSGLAVLTFMCSGLKYWFCK